MAQNTTPNSAPKFFNRDVVLYNSSLWGGPYGNTLIVAADGTVRASLTVVDLTTTGNTVLGNATSDTLVITGNSTFTGTATGNMVDIVATTTTTGKSLDVTGNTSLTSGILVGIGSSATAITGAGRLFSSAHSGITGPSATLNEFSSAAGDETIILQVTASGALAAGKALVLSGTSVTTGTILSASGIDALTTGGIAVFSSNSSDTGTRTLVSIVNDNTAATGTTALVIQNDATAGSHMKLTGTGVNGIDFTALTVADTIFNATAGTGCTAAPQTNAPVGFVNILIGGTQQWIPYYNAT